MGPESDTHAFTKQGDRLSNFSESRLDFIVIRWDRERPGLFLPLELVENHFIFCSSIVAIVRESVESEFGHEGRDQS